MNRDRYRIYFLLGALFLIGSYFFYFKLINKNKSEEEKYIRSQGRIEEAQRELQRLAEVRKWEPIGKAIDEWWRSLKIEQFGASHGKETRKYPGEVVWEEDIYEIYKFENLEVTIFSTYDKEKKSYNHPPLISSLKIRRNNFPPTLGVKIGDTEEKVIEKLGQPGKRKSSQLIYNTSTVIVKADFENGKLKELGIAEFMP